jgi:AcrR family transcriptional regulator
MASSSTSARRYRGTSTEERRAQRREQLIVAAVAVYGAQGYRNATVKSVCEAAGLTERYFYESFANSEALLVASFEAVTDTLLAGLKAAAASASGGRVERVRAVLCAYYEALKRDPKSARVFLVEIGGVSSAVDRALESSLRSLGDLLACTLDPDDRSSPLLRAGVVGSVIHIALAWIAGGYAEQVGEVADTALRLCRVLEPNAA